METKRKIGICTACALLFGLAGISCLSLGEQVSESKTTREPRGQEANMMPNISPTPDGQILPIRVNQARMSFWWWNEADAIGMDGDNPPAKKRYIDLEKWEYGDGDGITTYPHEVDLVAEIANDSSSSFRAKVRFRAAARFEDYYAESNCDESPWLDEDVVHEQNVLLATGVKIVERKNYDITPFLNKRHGKMSICAFRFSVQVVDTSGSIVASKEKVVPVLLGD
jgi:hypothetical protein